MRGADDDTMTDGEFFFDSIARPTKRRRRGHWLARLNFPNQLKMFDEIAKIGKRDAQRKMPYTRRYYFLKRQMLRCQRLHINSPHNHARVHRYPSRPKHAAQWCGALQALGSIYLLEHLARYGQVIPYRLLDR